MLPCLYSWSQGRRPLQAKAITQLEQRVQAGQQRAEESQAQQVQLQERLQQAEASHKEILQALGMPAVRLQAAGRMLMRKIHKAMPQWLPDIWLKTAL